MKHVEVCKDPMLDYSVKEAMNTLATNLSFCGEDVRCVQITSRYANEGKSTVAFKLAKTIASLGKSVVLVDTDLRCSRMIQTHQMVFEEPNYLGLAHYLSGQCELDDILYETNIGGMYFVPIGREVLSSLQLLSSPRLDALIAELRRIADMVVVDTSPAGVIVDALEVAKHCDGTLLVVGYNQGHMRELKDLKADIERAGCRVLGTVLNAVPRENYFKRNYYYKSRYYGSYYYRSDRGERKRRKEPGADEA